MNIEADYGEFFLSNGDTLKFPPEIMDKISAALTDPNVILNGSERENENNGSETDSILHKQQEIDKLQDCVKICMQRLNMAMEHIHDLENKITDKTLCAHAEVFRSIQTLESIPYTRVKSEDSEEGFESDVDIPPVQKIRIHSNLDTTEVIAQEDNVVREAVYTTLSERKVLDWQKKNQLGKIDKLRSRGEEVITDVKYDKLTHEAYTRRYSSNDNDGDVKPEPVVLEDGDQEVGMKQESGGGDLELLDNKTESELLECVQLNYILETKLKQVLSHKNIIVGKGISVNSLRKLKDSPVHVAYNAIKELGSTELSPEVDKSLFLLELLSKHQKIPRSS